MNTATHRNYKKSSIEWIGDIPAHWDVMRVTHMFREVVEAGTEGLPILSVSIHDGVSDEEMGSSELDRKVTRSDDKSKYKRVEPGDLVYNMMRAWQGGFGTVRVTGMVSPAYVVARPRFRFSTVFVEHLLRTRNAVEEMRRYSRGITDFRLRLYWDQFKSLVVVVPPIHEQVAIVAFIDQEAAKIDVLVEEQCRLIELLKEKRRAVISRGVTKGLNPNAPMKDSGIDWLGEVPAHWDVTRVGFRYEVQLGQMLNEERAQGANMRPYLRVADVQWNSINVRDLPQMAFPPDAQARYRLLPGDLIVNEGGSYVGRSAIWRGELEECYYQKALHRLRPYSARRDSSEFLLFVMEMATTMGVFVAGGNQTTIDHLTAEQLKSHRFAFPPLVEQLQIASHLSDQLACLQSLSAQAECAITLLRERRAALIAAAVTGKVDLRENIENQRMTA